MLYFLSFDLCLSSYSLICLFILTKNHFQTIQEKIEKVDVPLDVGRSRIKSSRGWLVLLPISGRRGHMCTRFVPHDVLPMEHRNYWGLFVQACILICKPIFNSCRMTKQMISLEIEEIQQMESQRSFPHLSSNHGWLRQRYSCKF